MAAILNFSQNCKTQKYLYLENRARQGDLDETFHPEGITSEYSHPNFHWAAILIF